MSTQAKLLRVLQDKTFERLGGTETITIDVRVIAATNKNLENEIKAARFREDLFYRLNVIPIHMPSLKERRDDIPILIDFFLDRYNNKFSKDCALSREALEILYAYDYPGNVRELENIIERCVALTMDNIIGPDDLPSSFVKHSKKGIPVLNEVVERAEQEFIKQVLKETNGNKTRAAEILGISRKTLWEKLTRYKT